MLITYVEADSIRLKKDIAQLQECVIASTEELEKLSIEFEELTQMWTGEASKHFFKNSRKDCKSAKNFYKKMESFISSMNFAAEEYSRCESDTERLISEIRI